MLNDLILAVTSNTFFVNELCKLAEDDQPNAYKNLRTLNKKAVYNIHLKKLIIQNNNYYLKEQWTNSAKVKYNQYYLVVVI